MNMVNGDSMSLIAKRYGVTRAAVSKRCVDITQRLNLPPSRAMRSLNARTTYRKTQLKLRSKDERNRNHRK
jgi:LysM repeat protein